MHLAQEVGQFAHRPSFPFRHTGRIVGPGRQEAGFKGAALLQTMWEGTVYYANGKC